AQESDACLTADSEETSALNADVPGEENRNQNVDVCEGEVYERYEETHFQRAWSMDRVRTLLEEAGMRFEAVYDAFTEKEPHQKSERVYFIAREHGK
ncbi:MAG: class I SAM-dependent methyltransferase, partial [Lachnospiraceae bacterium]|nr:class I SAM-dependent methyltransferase [Lachnospiraceae bacterium]